MFIRGDFCYKNLVSRSFRVGFVGTIFICFQWVHTISPSKASFSTKLNVVLLCFKYLILELKTILAHWQHFNLSIVGSSISSYVGLQIWVNHVSHIYLYCNGFFGNVTCTPCPSKRRKNSFEATNSLPHLKSFKKKHSDVSTPIYAYLSFPNY